MNKLLVILGPTSTGKTDIALKLAKRFNGELVSCDSRQIYKNLDIGTGKLPRQKVTVKKGQGFWEMNGINVWMYDVVGPKKQYTVYGFVKDTNKVVESILKKGKLPIIVGGTGLYLKALVEGLSNLSIPIDQKLRKSLEKLSLEELQKKLKKISSDKWGKMNYSDRQNPRRLIRSIELVVVKPQTGRAEAKSLQFKNVDILKIGLMAPRKVLYQRIDERVIKRINQGMVQEAEKLHKKGLSLKRMRQLGLEYGILADFLEGKIGNKEELVKTLQGKIHHFARRQETWFKKEKEVVWFDITTKDLLAQLEKKACSWYYLKNDQTN